MPEVSQNTSRIFRDNYSALRFLKIYLGFEKAQSAYPIGKAIET